jgi:hypothetical protein
MKKLIVSLFVSAALLCGVSAMAQNAAKPVEKAKTEVKTDVVKKDAKVTKSKKANKAKAVQTTEAAKAKK